MKFSAQERGALLALAAAAVDRGLDSDPNNNAELDLTALSPALRAHGAAFVTLELEGRLRGCIGSLEARRPLAWDVAANAHAAAFADPRFPPLSLPERAGLSFHISVLTPPEAFTVAGPRELFEALRPGVDGLVVRDGPRRATFLPSVWESLPRAEDFVGHLLEKAGLERHHWSPTLVWERYQVVEIRA